MVDSDAYRLPPGRPSSPSRVRDHSGNGTKKGALICWCAKCAERLFWLPEPDRINTGLLALGGVLHTTAVGQFLTTHIPHISHPPPPPTIPVAEG
ncbi:fructosyl amine:oxygen oxidoreductase-like protein [Anopheles sinensis]|uniref:Fructosyl amine:oxygen oxidoreductase-like protein n=1 Tax=Anopheles sinensis TaxID=74873 RepID=A0A084VUT9_ANOSI|nr:fructosyl amine:oxygen oxidoreductase-like protein [Anopheles sinensis]